MTSPPLTHVLQETLSVFDCGGDPLTTTEVAEELGLGRRSTYERLERLADEDCIETKKAGANARVWWQPRVEDRESRTGAWRGSDGSPIKDERELLYRTTREIAEADTFREGLRGAIRDVCQKTEWEYGEVWLPVEDSGIRRIDVDYYEEEFAEFAALSEGYTFDKGEGLPGRVWATGEFEWAHDVEEATTEEYPRRNAALATGLESALGVPIVADDETVAVLMFGMSETREVDEQLVDVVSSVAADLGHLVLRRRAEQTIERERDLIERILEASPVGIQVLDDEGEITRMNERVREILEIPADRADQYTPDDRAVYDGDGNPVDPEEHPFARALETGQPVFDWEAVVELPEAGQRWLSVNAAPVLDDDGNVERVVTTGEDITHHKRQTKRLQRQRDDVESELDEIFTRVDDAFYAVDEQFRFTYVNERAEELLQHPETELLGRSVWEVFPEATETPAYEAFHTALEEQRQTEYEVFYEPLDFWVEARVYPSESGVSVYFRDITEQKEREQELKRYETIVETVEDAIYVVDEDGYYTFVNEELASFFDCAPADVVGSHTSEYIDEETVSIGQRADQQLRESDRDSVTIEVELTEGFEEPRVFETTFTLLPESDPGERVGVARDVTHRKRRERALRDRVRQQEAVTELGKRALKDLDLDGLMSETVDLVADTLDTDYCKILDLDAEADELLLRQGVGWDDGTVGSATVSAVAEDSQAAFTLDAGQPVVVEDLSTEARFSGPDLLTDHDVRSGVSVIIGPTDDPWGILGTHDREQREFTEHDANFVQSVANILSTAINRHRHEQELIRRRQQLSALNDLNDAVREITDAVIDRSSREEIESIVCDHLTDVGGYELAWVGAGDAMSDRINIKSSAGRSGYLDDLEIVDDPDDDRGEGPTGRALRTGEMQTTPDVREDPQYEPWRDLAVKYGFHSSAAIPIVHEETAYGVLSVYADRPGAFEGQEGNVIAQLGEVVGHAIAATQRKRALESDEMTEVEFHVPNVFSTFGASDTLEGRVVFETAVPLDDDIHLSFGTATDPAIEGLRDYCDAIPHWESLTIRDGDSAEESRFELRASVAPLIKAVASIGGRLERAVVEDGDCTVTIHLSPTADVRQLTEAVQDVFPDARMVTRRQVVHPADTPERVSQEIEEELTDRQQAALKAAYYAGFFEWPREATGEEIAESLGIAPPTLSQHLRKAEKKVFSSILSNGGGAERNGRSA
jgi:PAS domain S-box-containing protein